MTSLTDFIAAQIKEHRIRAGASQAELALASGVSRKTISAIERGDDHGMRVHTVCMIWLGIRKIKLARKSLTPID